jgi:predicted RNA-binding Zn ribbon-like protein
MATDVEAQQFRLLGGHLSLDFVNTVGAWVTAPGRKSTRDYRDYALREKLSSYTDLVAWSGYAELLTERDAKQLLRTAENHPRSASAVVKRGLRLRETLYRLCKSVVEKWRADPADIERLNEELYIARGHQRLVSTGNKLGWKWDDSDEALDRVLWPPALSGAELLSSDDLSRLRQCGGEECGWLFLDTSRNRSRQWCEMSDCGNLAKVRRFRQRQA